jgi:nucleoside-diphosphate-sugar epimerase
VYGPGQSDHRKLIPYVVLSLLRGESPRLMSGSRAVDWIFVEDVADALLAAAGTAAIDGETLDVGSGELITVRHIVERLVRLVDPRIQPEFGAIADRPLEQVRVADTARTEALIGWKTSTSLEDGLARTVDWYADRFAPGPRRR